MLMDEELPGAVGGDMLECACRMMSSRAGGVVGGGGRAGIEVRVGDSNGKG